MISKKLKKYIKSIDKYTFIKNSYIKDIVIIKLKNVYLKNKIEKIIKSIKETDEKIIRSNAEIENIRNRSKKEINISKKFALENFANDLLPIMDSMEKASEIKSKSKKEEAIIEGIKLIIKLSVKTLKKYEIKQISPKIGDLLDTNKHEVMATKKNLKTKENEILYVFQKGYKINNRVIRPARVLLTKNN